MSIEKRQMWCPDCQRNVLGERENGMGDGIGCLLIIITGGLFLPIFLILRLVNSAGSYRCPMCGGSTKYGKSQSIVSLIALGVLVAVGGGFYYNYRKLDQESAGAESVGVQPIKPPASAPVPALVADPPGPDASQASPPAAVPPPVDPEPSVTPPKQAPAKKHRQR